MGEAGIHFLLEAVENADAQFQQQKQYFMASMQAMVRALGLPGPLSPLPVHTRGRKRARGQAAAGKENLGLTNALLSHQKKASRTARYEKVEEDVEVEALEVVHEAGERLHEEGGKGYQPEVSPPKDVAEAGDSSAQALEPNGLASHQLKGGITARDEKDAEAPDVAHEVCRSGVRKGGELRATPPKEPAPVRVAVVEPAERLHENGGENQARVTPPKDCADHFLKPCSEQKIAADDQLNREPEPHHPEEDTTVEEQEEESGSMKRVADAGATVQFLEPSLIEQEFQFFVDPGLTVDDEVEDEEVEEPVEDEQAQAPGDEEQQSDAEELPESNTFDQTQQQFEESVDAPVEEQAHEADTIAEEDNEALAAEISDVPGLNSPEIAPVDEHSAGHADEEEAEREAEYLAPETRVNLEPGFGRTVSEQVYEPEIVPVQLEERPEEIMPPTGEIDDDQDEEFDEQAIAESEDEQGEPDDEQGEVESDEEQDSEADRQMFADEQELVAERSDDRVLVPDSGDEQEFAADEQVDEQVDDQADEPEISDRVAQADDRVFISMELGAASELRSFSAKRTRTEGEFEAHSGSSSYREPSCNEEEAGTRRNSPLVEKAKNSEAAPKSFNLVSNLRSFLPFVVPQQPALAIANGKREVKVKALEAAEVARKQEERKAEERKARKVELLKQTGNHPGVSTRSKRPQEGKGKLEEKKKRDEEFRKRKAQEEAEREAKKQKRMEKEKEIVRRRKAEQDAKANWLAGKEADRKRREETFQRMKVLEKEQRRHVDKRPVAEILQALTSQSHSQSQATGEVQREKSLGLLGHAMRIPKDSSQRKAVSLSSLLRNSFNAKQSMSGGEVFPGTPVVKPLDLKKQLYSTPFAGGEVDEEEEEEEDDGPVSYEISPYKNSDDEEDEGDEDDEQEKLQKPIPKWARKENLMPQLVRQAHVDPDKIFIGANSCSLNQVFGTTGNRKRKDFAERGRSGDWVADMVTWKEELLYKKSMGYL